MLNLMGMDCETRLGRIHVLTGWEHLTIRWDLEQLGSEIQPKKDIAWSW